MTLGNPVLDSVFSRSAGRETFSSVFAREFGSPVGLDSDGPDLARTFARASRAFLEAFPDVDLAEFSMETGISLDPDAWFESSATRETPFGISTGSFVCPANPCGAGPRSDRWDEAEFRESVENDLAFLLLALAEKRKSARLDGASKSRFEMMKEIEANFEAGKKRVDDLFFASLLATREALASALSDLPGPSDPSLALPPFSTVEKLLRSVENVVDAVDLPEIARTRLSLLRSLVLDLSARGKLS